ncbi:MAG TPA: hypothetical protein VGC27_10015, partial [Rhizomicrobium sp.]
MIEDVQLGRIEEAIVRFVEQERLVVPTVPEALDDLNIFGGAGVPLLMADLFLEAEIARFGIRGGGDEVPTGPAAAD